jgi:hypothetical protein
MVGKDRLRSLRTSRSRTIGPVWRQESQVSLMLPCRNCTIHDPNGLLSPSFHGNYHANIHAVALACPGVDYIRLWPLPVVQP